MLVSIAGSAWDAAQLLDLGNLQQWSEDLSGEQIRGILGQVPGDSRINVACILTAVAEGDRVAIKRQAHRLKGMAANIGALRLAELARTLEYGVFETGDLVSAAAALPAVLEDTLLVIEQLKIPD